MASLEDRNLVLLLFEVEISSIISEHSDFENSYIKAVPINHILAHSCSGRKTWLSESVTYILKEVLCVCFDDVRRAEVMRQVACWPVQRN